MATPLTSILTVLSVAVMATACSSDEPTSTAPGGDATAAPDTSGTPDGTVAGDSAGTADGVPDGSGSVDGAGPDAVVTGCSTAADCDDGVPCTVDACAAGLCDNTLAPGNCLIDGVCFAETEPKPGATCLTCQAAVSTSTWTEVAGACDDGVSCTDDRCDSAVGCVNEVADVCDDGLACTTDVCDLVSGCTNTLDADACVIDGACFGLDALNPASMCGSCQPAVATDAWSEVVGGCDDGAACTDDVCDPVNGCTNSVQTGFCFIDGLCFADGEVNPDNECLTCQPSVATGAWSPRTGSCDDGEDCTYDDACDAGVCVGVAYSCDDGLDCTTDICFGNGACGNSAKDGFCEILGVCYAMGDINPDNECQWCSAEDLYQYIWVPVESGTSCASDGLACTKDVCISGTCSHPLEDTILACLIDGACYGSGQTNPGQPCQWCDANEDTFAWTDKPLGSECADCKRCAAGLSCAPADDLDLSACDDGDGDTLGDLCRGGTCGGFDVTLTDEGKTQEGYTHAREASNGGVHALYKDCSGVCYHHAEYFDGTMASEVDAQLGFAVAHPGFGDGFYTSLDTMWVYTGNGWSDSTGLASVFNATAPDATWHTVARRDQVAGLVVVDVVGWQSGAGGAPITLRCTYTVLCPTCPWQCTETLHTPDGNDQEMRECVAVVEDGFNPNNGDPKANLYCHDTDSTGTPSQSRYWGWQESLNRWHTFLGTTVALSPGQRLMDVQRLATNAKVLVGKKGLLELDGAGGYWGPLAVSALGADQADTDFLAVTQWEGFTLVLGVTTKDAGGGMQTSEVVLLSNPSDAGGLADGDAWVVAPLATYSCPSAGPCPYEVTSMASHETGIYVFGAWSPDGVERDRAVWHWTAP